MIGINYTEFSPSEWVDRSYADDLKHLTEMVDDSIEKWKEIIKVCGWKFISDEDEQKRIEILTSIPTVCGMCNAFNWDGCENCPLFTEKECYNKDPYKTIYRRVNRYSKPENLPNNEHLIQEIVDYGEELVEYLEGFKKHLLEGE